MELYSPLPEKLLSCTVKSLQPHTIASLRYLWRAAHEMLSVVTPTNNEQINISKSKTSTSSVAINASTVDKDSINSISISHRLSRRFMSVVLENGVTLPSEVLSRICENCCVLQIPSLTCRSRLKPRSCRSKVNRKSKSPEKLKNQIIRTCFVCSHKANISIGCPLKRPNKSKEAAESTQESQTIAPMKSVETETKTSTKKFSFHDSLDRRYSAPAKLMSALASDYIPLSEPSKLTAKRTLNLIEQERANKKMKKKMNSVVNSSTSLSGDDIQQQNVQTGIVSSAHNVRHVPQVARQYKNFSKISTVSSPGSLTVNSSLASLKSVFKSNN